MRLTKAGAIAGHKAFIIHRYTEVARVCVGNHFPSVARCREIAAALRYPRARFNIERCLDGCPRFEGGLNRSPQHFILEGKDGVWDGTEISQRVYCGREDGVMGSLEARGVAKGDRAGFWQAVIVDLFSGGSAWWDSSRGSSSLQVGIDACGTRGDFQRCYGTSIGPVDRQTAWPLTLDGEPGNASQWRL